jgi:hypothetical protein
MAGASTARPIACQHQLVNVRRTPLTVALLTRMINAGTSNEHVVSNREDALTTNPLPISAPDSSIVENSRLIELHTTIVDLASKRHFVRMEVLEAR